MDTSDDEGMRHTLEETLERLDAYHTGHVQLAETDIKVEDAEPDPEAIDSIMQMLVESGWEFESKEASEPIPADSSISTHPSAMTNAASTLPSYAHAQQSTAFPSSGAVRQRSTALDSIDVILNQRMGRGRAREQLIQLRAVVQALEARLVQLQQETMLRVMMNQPGAAFPIGNAGNVHSQQSSAASPGGDVEMWRQIAERQYEARRRVEEENARLRSSLQSQIEVARRLERILKKRQPNELP